MFDNPVEYKKEDPFIYRDGIEAQTWLYHLYVGDTVLIGVWESEDYNKYIDTYRVTIKGVTNHFDYIIDDGVFINRNNGTLYGNNWVGTEGYVRSWQER